MPSYDIKFNVETQEIIKNVGKLNSKFDAALMMYATTKATQLENYMKVNRPWVDRTGEAKRRLSAQAESYKKHGVQIVLSHGVSYGVWLELSHQKRYAIIEPTVRTKGNEVLSGCRDLLSKLVL